MKRLLVVIDYQNDFVSGSLGFDDAVILEDYLVELIEKYHLNKDDVIFTYDSHQNNYLNTQEGKNLPITHCIENSKGWQLFGKINDLAKNDKKILKNTFGSLELGNYLKDKDYDEITLVGVVSNICVISNAVIIKSALPEATIIIDCKGIASNDSLLHEKAIDLMANLHMQIINKE